MCGRKEADMEVKYTILMEKKKATVINIGQEGSRSRDADLGKRVCSWRGLTLGAVRKQLLAELQW